MSIQNILFLDIETVSQYPEYNQLPDYWKELWQPKAQTIIRNNEKETIETSYQRAGLYAEFGKIVCISCGHIDKDDKTKLNCKSFFGDDERKLLQEFADVLNNWALPPNNQSASLGKFLCAHNGKEFDFPFICRRMIINGIKIPIILDISGKKPWEIQHYDTLEMWKFGDFKYQASLKILAATLGIPSPKDDIDGSMVNEVYWKQKNLPRIETYCKKDIITLAKIFQKIKAI